MASDLVFTVKANTTSAAASFKKLSASILPIKKESDDAAKSMAKMGKTKVTPKADAAQIHKITTEIGRLQEELRHKISLDVNADTRDVQTKIRRLQSTLKTLKSPRIDPQVGTGFVDKIKSALGSVTSGLQRFGSGLADVFRNIGVPLIGAIGVAVTGVGVALGATAVKALNLADQMERAKLQMDSFTHNTTATVKLLAQVQAYADKTPFEFPELASAAKRLLGVGVTAGKIPTQLAKIGDIAAQAGASVDDLALIFAQMTSAGRVNAEDMNQLADRGINAWPTLAKKMHMSVAEVRDLSSKGKLGVAQVKLLWDSLAKGAAGSTGKLADTLSGQISTLKDTVNGVLRQIGNALLPFAKVVVPQLTKGVEGLGAKVLGALPQIIDMIAKGLQGLVDLPGQILRGLASVSLGFMGMVSDIEASLSSLLGGIGLSLRNIPGLGDAAGSMLKASEDLAKSSQASAIKGQTMFAALTIQAQQFDTAVRPLKGKIEEARKIAQQGIVMSVSVQAAQGNIDSLTTKLDKLKRQKPTAEVRANIRDTEAKLARAKEALEWLNVYTAHPKLLAKDLASGKVKIVNGALQKVPKSHNTNLTATDKTGRPTSSAKSNVKDVPSSHSTTLSAKDQASSKARTVKRSVEDIPTSHTTTLHINTVRKTVGGSGSSAKHTGDSGSNVGASSLAVPQVSVYVRDQSLAGLIDIRVNQRAARAARIIHRRDVILT